jgi:ubiquitin carboxyl-terminal hydrolase 8
MNSIMQCLSNTNALVQYVIDDTYIGQVNRKNKTQGRIIEEVAAVLKALWRGEYKFIASKDLRVSWVGVNLDWRGVLLELSGD